MANLPASPLLEEFDDAIHNVTVSFRENPSYKEKYHFGVKKTAYQLATSSTAIPAQTVRHKEHEAAVATEYQQALIAATKTFTAAHPEFTWWFIGANVATIPSATDVKARASSTEHSTAIYKAPAK